MTIKKVRMDKQTFISYAQDMVDGSTLLERALFMDEIEVLTNKIKEANIELPFPIFAFESEKYMRIRKDIGEIMLEYAKGSTPFPKLKHKPFTNNSIALLKLLLEQVKSYENIANLFLSEKAEERLTRQTIAKLLNKDNLSYDWAKVQESIDRFKLFGNFKAPHNIKSLRVVCKTDKYDENYRYYDSTVSQIEIKFIDSKNVIIF